VVSAKVQSRIVPAILTSPFPRIVLKQAAFRFVFVMVQPSFAAGHIRSHYGVLGREKFDKQKCPLLDTARVQSTSVPTSGIAGMLHIQFISICSAVPSSELTRAQRRSERVCSAYLPASPVSVSASGPASQRMMQAAGQLLPSQTTGVMTRTAQPDDV
jgi:hypothetical protein